MKGTLTPLVANVTWKGSARWSARFWMGPLPVALYWHAKPAGPGRERADRSWRGACVSLPALTTQWDLSRQHAHLRAPRPWRTTPHTLTTHRHTDTRARARPRARRPAALTEAGNHGEAAVPDLVPLVLGVLRLAAAGQAHEVKEAAAWRNAAARTRRPRGKGQPTVAAGRQCSHTQMPTGPGTAALNSSRQTSSA